MIKYLSKFVGTGATTHARFLAENTVTGRDTAFGRGGTISIPCMHWGQTAIAKCRLLHRVVRTYESI